MRAFKVVSGICICIFFSSCHMNSGFYSPSFDGIQTVYDKGQSVHSTTIGPFVGTYFNYSPIKNIGVFADVRFNHFLPQAAVALGGYSPRYILKKYVNNNGITQKYQIGYHFDSYLGFGYIGGRELIDERDGSGFGGVGSELKFNELEFKSSRVFFQTGAHLKAREIKFDMLYRLNYIDIEKIVFKPVSENYVSYVNYLADNNPFIINELQFLLSLGRNNLRTSLGCTLALKGMHDKVIDYSKFNVVQIGFTYIFDNIDYYSIK